MSIFLKAKHWQLFLLLFVLPIFLFFIGIALFFANFDFQALSESEPSPELIMDMFSNISLMFTPMIVVFIIQYCWYWSVAIGLKRYLPEGLAINSTLFKVCFFVSLIYISSFVLLSFGFSQFLKSIIDSSIDGNIQPNFVIGRGIAAFSMIFPLHLFSMFSMFYIIYHSAKTIKTVIAKKHVTFSDFVEEFFLIWFFPIGIWFIQPKINAIFEGKKPEEEGVYNN